jgi:hypothetical protein
MQPKSLTDSAAIDLLPFASGLRRALQASGGTHTLTDVVRLIDNEKAQLWLRDRSCIVTQIKQYPQKRVLLFWLATGEREELFEMYPLINAWAKRVPGCELAIFTGRRGWERTALVDDGWKPVLTKFIKEI